MGNIGKKHIYAHCICTMCILYLKDFITYLVANLAFIYYVHSFCAGCDLMPD